MINKHILPLGSVVLLKGGDIKLIIVGRAQLFNNEGTIGYFDYSALGYPQGVIAESNFAFFNDEDIKKVLFEGYRDEQEVAFADSYAENMKNVLYPKLVIEREIEEEPETFGF